MSLQVVTFSSTPLSEDNLLWQSCQAFNLDLKVIVEPEWQVNAQKIGLLYQYIEGMSAERLLLVVDAYDVIINSSEEQIVARFQSLQTEIVFGAEANFYFRNADLRAQYFRNYPKSETIYKFLNSGTMMGSSTKIKKILKEILDQNELDYLDRDSFVKVRSDQYLYAKVYVDHAKKDGWGIGLDTRHHLFEVTGGRMRVFCAPHISELHAFNAYKLERFLLKLCRLNRYQNKLMDLRYQAVTAVFENIKTNTTPMVIHIPGSWVFFKETIRALMDQKPRERSLYAYLIGFLSYVVAMLIPSRIRI